MTTETITILIGNSDNKLTQERWSDFVDRTRSAIKAWSNAIHFDGGSNHDSRYQNACFVAVIDLIKKQPLCDHLCRIRKSFDQDSIAIIAGQTELIEHT